MFIVLCTGKHRHRQGRSTLTHIQGMQKEKKGKSGTLAVTRTQGHCSTTAQHPEQYCACASKGDSSTHGGFKWAKSLTFKLCGVPRTAMGAVALSLRCTPTGCEAPGASAGMHTSR